MEKKYKNYGEWYAQNRPWTEEELLAAVHGITEEQAEFSDVGGDSDADDITEEISSASTRSSGVSTPQSSTSVVYDVSVDQPVVTSSAQLLEEIYDSDDSVDDPSYQPEDPRPLQTSLLPSSDSEQEDQANEEVVSEFQWSKTGCLPQRYNNFNFTENIHPNVNIETEDPIDFFKIFYTGAFIEEIVEQSNLYAVQSKKPLETHQEEVSALLGILIIMGFNVRPSQKKYWSADPNFHCARVANVFSRRRFLQLLRFIHFNDNTRMPRRGTPNYDKLYKIRPMLDHFKQVFRDTFTPGRSLAVDESMVAFTGRSSLKQYMPMKPIKRGFKIWALACSETGYLHAFEVYQGKSDANDEHTLGERVVLNLAEDFRGKGNCLYFDNFFCTIPLMEKLARMELFGCGTIRQNRKYFPKESLKLDKTISMGQSDFVMSGDVSICKWKDRGTKCVTVCSNMHNGSGIGNVLRTSKIGSREVVPCPESIVDYNKFMGGVDRFDQRMATYNIAWKSRRWWMKLFFYFTDAAIVNTYILYLETLKRTNPRKKPLSHLQFRSKLADQLIVQFTSRKRRGPPTTVDPLHGVGHLPEKTSSRRCRQCAKRGTQKRSSVQCKKCEVALCVECFVPYHT